MDGHRVSVGDVCMQREQVCHSRPVSLPYHLAAIHHPPKKKKKKTCLIRSANQAPMATVPREAAYTLTCLMRHGPLWDACQKTAQPCGNCSDSGAHWEGNGLENTWSLSFDIDGRSGEGGIILEIFIGCLLCVRHCSRKWVSSMNKILSLSTALLNLL